MPAIATPRMHYAVAVKISSYSFHTKTFLIRHSKENFDFEPEATKITG